MSTADYVTPTQHCKSMLNAAFPKIFTKVCTIDMNPLSIIATDNHKLNLLSQTQLHKNTTDSIIHQNIARTPLYFIERHRGTSVDLRENMHLETINHQNNERKTQEERLPTIYSNKEKVQNEGKYGGSEKMKVKPDYLDRFKVYERQQKPFDIINCYPNNGDRQLRLFPKLTLEHKLIENGRNLHYYHSNNP